jgi:hypothetical protein
MSIPRQINRSSSAAANIAPSPNIFVAAALPVVGSPAEVLTEHAPLLQQEFHVVSTKTLRKVYVYVAIALFYVLTFTLLASVLHRRHGFPVADILGKAND